MKNRNLTMLLIFLLAVLIGFILSCDLPPAPASDSNDLTKKVSWPPAVADNQETIVVAENLLAKNYEIVLDGSGSMGYEACGGDERKELVAERALVTFIQSIPADTNVGLVAFDSKDISERMPLGTGLEHRDALVRAIHDVGADSGTPLHSAIKLAYEKLLEQARRQRGYGEYHLIVVTDGQPFPLYLEDPSNIVAEILASSPVVIHTIGFCIDENHALNQPGKVVYREASDEKSLTKALEEILVEAPVE